MQLNTDPTWPRSLKGVRADAVVKLLMGQELVAEEAGQVQFTDYGVSGPVIFQLSRLAVTADAPVLLSLDLLPHVSQEELVELLAQRQMLCPELTLENLLTGMLHNRLGRTVIRYGGRKLGDAVMDLTRKNLTAIAKNVKDFRLPGDWRSRTGARPGHRRWAGHGTVCPGDLGEPPGARVSTPPEKCWTWTGTAADLTCNGPGPAGIWLGCCSTDKRKTRSLIDCVFFLRLNVIRPHRHSLRSC